MRRFLALFFVLALCLSPSVHAYPVPGGDLIFAGSFDLPVAARGGSNYLWYGLTPDCDPEPYGLIASYHLATTDGASVRVIAQQQLAAMHASGMRRLSLGIFFIHGTSSRTLVDSSDPAQVAQAVANIGNLLADVKAAGFDEILFRFFPTASINPSQPDFDPQLVDEYWNLIVAIRPTLVAVGLPYRIDLMVEGAPRDSNPPIVSNPWKYPANRPWSEAVRTLWQRYYPAYGASDTIGFSFLTDDDPNKLRSRVRHMRYVYEGHYPSVFAADFYGSAAASEAEKFVALHAAMAGEDPSGSLGWRDAGWIIAEAFYDDPIAAANFNSAIASTGRRVWYLTQWPLDRANMQCGTGVNVTPPLAWTVYGGYGF